MDIYFAGIMQSTFIQQDADLLSENHKLTIFDFSKHAASFSNIHKFLIRAFLEWNNVRKSDVVILWFADYPALPFIVWAQLFRKPIIIHVGGWEVYSAPEIKYGNQLNLIRGFVTRWILRNSTVCVCMSEAYKNIILTCESKSKVCIIPGWVDVNYDVSKLQKDESVITALISIKFTNFLKGIPTFLKSTKSLDAKVIENIPHDELINLLKTTRVYCQLSYTESFGMTLLEAMSCGCIPVVTDRDALPEVVGGCGYIVPYGDVDATRRAILKAMESKDTITVYNRAKMFSKERAKILIESLLKEVCE
jgi:glycosyltransferase involved in cell wall biosynthesis